VAEPISALYRREADRLLWIIESLTDREARAELKDIATRYAALAHQAREREKAEAAAQTRRAG